MNIYEKLQKARTTLQNANLKKTGNNKFAGYMYFELADFLPTINEIFLEMRLCGVVRYDLEMASLTVVNSEKTDETIVFTSPMSTAALKGCHEVQNLGAVETYIRRYLYVTALEITESDALDKTHGKDTRELKEDHPADEMKFNPPEPKRQETRPATPSHPETMSVEDIQRADIEEWLTKMGLDADTLEGVTGFTSKKTGEQVKGVRDVQRLSGQRLEIAHHKIHEMYKKTMPQDQALPF